MGEGGDPGCGFFPAVAADGRDGFDAAFFTLRRARGFLADDDGRDAAFLTRTRAVFLMAFLAGLFLAEAFFAGRRAGAFLAVFFFTAFFLTAFFAAFFAVFFTAFFAVFFAAALRAGLLALLEALVRVAFFFAGGFLAAGLRRAPRPEAPDRRGFADFRPFPLLPDCVRLAIPPSP